MLEVRNISLAIGSLSILNGVSFSVEEGETLGVIGPNGSGKTTLFNCLSGFLVPQGGKILFRNSDITHLPPHERARVGLGRVFQNPGVFREMSLRDNLITAIEGRQTGYETFFPWSARQQINRKNAEEYLTEVGLREKAEVKASSLSGGQMRLLEIVRTLAFGAELFLLDEPTAGVSPKMKDEVALAIRKLQERKKTVLIIEHDINFIEKFCDRIVVMDVGKVVIDGSPQTVRQSPVLQEIYFGSL